MLYFLNFNYEPNTAVYNRLMGYYKALDYLGIKATVIFLYPSINYDRVNYKFKNIDIIYFWNKWMPYRGPFRRLTFNRYIKSFISKLKPGDIVYTYGIDRLTYLCVQVNGIKVYAERTEHPKASNGVNVPFLFLSDTEINYTLKKLNGIFVISKPLKDFYVGLGVSEQKVHIINMIVDISRFDNLKKHSVAERYIAYCGTASNNKDGVDELIKAFYLVTKQISDINLYIIGKTPEKKGLFSNLTLVKELGIQDKVRFFGEVSANDIPQLLKNADVLALNRPNNLQAQYGFPTKLGEYLLTKNPVVVTNVGDIPIFLKDGVSAFISEPSNAKMFSEKIIYAISNPDSASLIGNNGYKVAVESFNYITETKKIISIIYSEDKDMQ